MWNATSDTKRSDQCQEACRQEPTCAAYAVFDLDEVVKHVSEAKGYDYRAPKPCRLYKDRGVELSHTFTRFESDGRVYSSAMCYARSDTDTDADAGADEVVRVSGLLPVHTLAKKIYVWMFENFF